MMIEQPLGWDDLYSHVELQKKSWTPRSALMNAFTRKSTARAAIELGGLQNHEHKARPRRAATPWRGAFTISASATVFPSGAGGMLESGIGRAPQHRTFDASQFHASPAMWLPANAIGRKISSFLKSRLSAQGTIRVPY